MRFALLQLWPLALVPLSALYLPHLFLLLMTLILVSRPMAFKFRLSIFIFIFISPLIAACSSPARKPEPLLSSISAVYLVHGQGELDQRELDRHPEVVVVNSFDAVKQYATQTKVAIWIDKNAAFDLTDANKLWLEEMPQTTYPIAVLGYDAATTFNKVLGRCCRSGIPDSPHMFFSVIQGKEKTDNNPFYSTAFSEEYSYKPHVQDIIDITDRMLMAP